jgi:predicted nucleic acid-binding protein
MNLERIANGATIFIDANIFIYAVGLKSVQCRQLLRRCASRAVVGKTTTAVIAEVCHRRMLIEARAKGILPAKAAPQELAKKRALIGQLTDYEQEVRDLLAGEIKVEPVLPEDFSVALLLQKQFGLLTNDSLNLAVAKRLGLTEIVTADSDFAAVNGFVVYGPDDLPGSMPSAQPS